MLAVILLVQLPSMRNAIDLVIGIAWPGAALIAIWWFRDEIKRLIERLRKIGRTGAEFEHPQPTNVGNPSEPDLPSAPTPGTKSAPEALIAPAFRPLFDQLVARTKERLPAVQQILSGSTEEILIAWGAEAGAALHLERASRFIFQSQIEALETLKPIQTSVDKSAFKPFYDKAVHLYPLLYSNYSFEQWFGFLVAMELVLLNPENTFTITPAGQVLSLYMAQRNYGLGIPA